MSDCLYRISYRNNNGEDVKKEFNSENELDVFLASHLQELIDKFDVKTSDLTLHTTPVEHTLTVIEKIKDKLKDAKEKKVIINEDGDSEIILDISKSIGVTKFITTQGEIGSPKDYLITPFNAKDYFDTVGLNEKERKIKSTQWDDQTDCGSEIHELFECIVSGKEFKNRKFLSESQVENLTDSYKDLLEELKAKHGENAQFLTEVPIISDDINQAYKNIGIESINGKIDLLVIDDRGVAHIYDFKISTKNIGDWACSDNKLIKEKNWWTTTKKYTCEYQQYFYRAILSQYGIVTGALNIVPIIIDPVFDEKTGNIKELSKVFIDGFHIQPLDYSNARTTTVQKIIPKKVVDVNLEGGLENMKKFFPNYSLEAHLQRNEVTFEQYKVKYVHELKEGSKNRYVVNNPYKGPVYCDTEEEVDRAIRSLVDEENTYRSQEMWDLGNLLKMTLTGEKPVSEFVFGNNNYVQDYIRQIFKKYLPDEDSTENEKLKGWQLEENENFIAAGMFIFRKGSQIEVVSLTYGEIHQDVKLGLGNSILGTTKRNFEIDENKVIKSTHGNIDLIKVMSILNSNSDILKDGQIISVKTFNIWTQNGTTVDNDVLFDNFEKLCNEHNVQCNLSSSDFATVLQSTVCEINDICGEELFLTMSGLRELPNNIIEGTPKIIRAMEKLKQRHQPLRNAVATGQFNFDDPLQVAYMLLGKALNKLGGYEIYIETDPAKWLGISKKGLYSGLNVNSANNSPSLNIRTLARINAIAENKIRALELKWDTKLRKAFRNYYEYHSRNRFWGHEVKYFDNLFRRDSSGNIDQRFLLIHPEDAASKEERELVEVLLEVFNYYRYNGNAQKIASKKDTDEYYEVPIMLGSTATLLHNTNFYTALKHKIDENLNFLRLLPEEERNLMDSRKRKELFNRFRIDSNARKTIISNYGISQLETQLEDVVRNYIHSFAMEEVMQDYLPKMQGIKIALQYQQHMFGAITQDVIDFIDKFIDINVYETPIMDSNLRTVYKCLATVKNITTAATLGFNWRSGVREFLQGAWVHITRVLAESYGKDQFTHSEVAQAWNIIFRDSISNINVLTLCDALNVTYGMANADPHQVKDVLSQSQSGIMNFNSDKLYIFNRVPDSYHRLGLLIAKMIHDGCWEAHEIVDDELVYDFKKDSRFNLLNDPNADKTSSEYKKQHSLYTTMREQFNREGWTLQEGDDLPRAYTVQEGTSIKSFAELCFGHYDRSTQMLAKHMFLGALFLQFRTFLSAKLEQWILKPGTYDQGQIKEVYDHNGELLCRVYTTDENGVTSFEVVPESQVDKSKYWEPHTEWQGRFMEGMLYSMWSFTKALAKMDINEWKALWANETKRANFVTFCTDMIWMAIMMWIIAAIFMGDKEEQTPLAHGLTSAVYNSFADGPIINIIASMGGDLNPPSYSIVKNLCKQTWSVLTGDKSVFDGLTNSIGALNDFKYVTNQLD